MLTPFFVLSIGYYSPPPQHYTVSHRQYTGICLAEGFAYTLCQCPMSYAMIYCAKALYLTPRSLHWAILDENILHSDSLVVDYFILIPIIDKHLMPVPQSQWVVILMSSTWFPGKNLLLYYSLSLIDIYWRHVVLFFVELKAWVPVFCCKSSLREIYLVWVLRLRHGPASICFA